MFENKYETSTKLHTTLISTKEINEIHLAEIKNRVIYVNTLMKQLPLPSENGAYILLVKEGNPLSYFSLVKDSISIGRSQDSYIPVDDENVSRLHCVIERNNSIFTISDNESKNGMTVNGEKMQSRILCDGDIMRIGSYELIFVLNKNLTM